MANIKIDWTIVGINLIPSDEIYKQLQRALAAGDVQSLRGIAGHKGPMDVDFATRTVTFRNL